MAVTLVHIDNDKTLEKISKLLRNGAITEEELAGKTQEELSSMSNFVLLIDDMYMWHKRFFSKSLVVVESFIRLWKRCNIDVIILWADSWNEHHKIPERIKPYITQECKILFNDMEGEK